MRLAAPFLRPRLEEGACLIEMFIPWQVSLCQQLQPHCLVPYVGAAFKQVAIKRMEDYLFDRFFGMSTMLWPVNSHSLLTYIKMQSALLRCSSPSIVTESKDKSFTGFVGKDWEPFEI